MLEKTFGGVYDNEPQFEVWNEPHEEENPEYTISAMIHPWRRRYYDGTLDGSVYISLSNRVLDGDDPECVFENVIVDREEFVEGLLYAFPELMRRA